MNTCTSCECVDNIFFIVYNNVVNTSLEKSCSFFGHSNISQDKEVERKLLILIEKLIVEEGYNLFYFGGFGDFDTICYKVVSALRQKYKHVKRVFCLTEEKYLSPSKRPKWLQEEEYEEFIYFTLENNYWYKRIYFRNCEIIKRSELIIFFVKNEGESGARKALNYAIKTRKKMINIALE